MEVNSLQVHELHKKFEDLNEEISQALRHQEDAINSTAAVTNSNLTASVPRNDVLRLTTRAIDWRDDVNALSKHIDLQLQNSRALRSKEAEVLSRDGENKQEDDDSAKMRCLRSDLRLLQEFRITHFRAKTNTGSKDFATAVETMDAEGKHQKDLVDKSIRAEKSGRKDAQTAMMVQLFEARRELTGKISEDILKDKKQLDLDAGLSDLVDAASRSGAGSNGDKDMLASWDAQLYLRLIKSLLNLEKELNERYTTGGVQVLSSPAAAPHQQGQAEHKYVTAREKQRSENGSDEYGATTVAAAATTNARRSSAVVANPSAPAASLDEVTFTLQKLRRDYFELKNALAKAEMANAQLEDDLANLQRKYDDEKRSHMNEKKWYVPKIQKLEETGVTTSRAFEALKLNVELLTNMYKTLRQTLLTHELEENELKLERDKVTELLADEIKKVALLTKENARREKLVTIAMSARHEMCALAKLCESRMKALEKDKSTVEQRAKEQADELAMHKLQLEGAYTRLEATDNALRAVKSTIERLHSEMEVCVEAGKVKEIELKGVYEKERQALQQRFDKTKRELMDAMSQNVSLDGRLRKAQDKLNKLSGGPAGGDAAASGKTKDTTGGSSPTKSTST